MIAEIEVIQPGLFSSLQDNGRYGYLKFGVPISGAMDSTSAKLANLLLQNSGESAVLEITQFGPTLKFFASTKLVICGADLSPVLNEHAINNNVVFQVGPGDILKFKGRKTGARAYLGIAGGFLQQDILGSKSWYEGITDHFRLQKGMKLSFHESHSSTERAFAHLKMKSDHISTNILPVFPGPEYRNLSSFQRKALVKQEFRLDRNNNRMAVQLVENFQNNLSPIATGPVVPGTVQLTPSGKLIVLMRDCQTTGGYPRILQLLEEGINILSQKVEGETLKFDIRKYW